MTHVHVLQLYYNCKDLPNLVFIVAVVESSEMSFLFSRHTRQNIFVTSVLSIVHFSVFVRAPLIFSDIPTHKIKWNQCKKVLSTIFQLTLFVCFVPAISYFTLAFSFCTAFKNNCSPIVFCDILWLSLNCNGSAFRNVPIF